MLKKLNRIICCSILTLILIFMFINIAFAENFPTKTITIVVAGGVGGGTDVGARILASYMEDYLGVNIIVQNKPGGGQLVGTQSVYVAPKDGYTILCTSFVSEYVVEKNMNAEYSVDEFVGIGAANQDPLFIVEKTGTFGSIDNLIKVAQERNILFSSTGLTGGDAYHVQRAADALGIRDKIRIVPYDSGSEELAALLGGHIDIQPRAGGYYDRHGTDVTILAVASLERWPGLEDVPTLYEITGKKIKLGHIRGLVVHKDVPKERIEVLRKAFAYAVEQDGIEEKFMNAGLGFGALIGEDLDNRRREIWSELEEYRETWAVKD